ncbi:hypothetical protein KR52_00200 [Synechococcus sp. KORDI-52]|uniref:hypothetical protein n=1 Tax=Synechococcus sp. KORDI-52 TaxID=585425 RepID=UPI0004E0A52F|nr:hypothetical protein [Synechococcus sp. KORDI-52]AII47618.1 hypothetical protein KR52_00200 [Synechococcus sp. KORDI-52]
MLTIESTIMDIAMGVDATDWRNVVFLFGCSLEGGRKIGMFREFVRRALGGRMATKTEISIVSPSSLMSHR